jgi:alpha-beta hydrolase superfamily lysophospholipase
MKHTTGTFPTKAGDLFFQAWIPGGDLRAAIVISHGVGEHSGRYMNLVGPLTDHGITVWAYDHLGCGSSPGQRGHIETWADYRNALGAYLNLVHSKHPGLPVFLYGHSMGAQIVLDYIQENPEGLQGVILSGTPIDPAGVESPLKILIARLLSRVRPTFSIDLGLDPASLSRDAQVVQSYRDDPLVQRYVSVRWGTEALFIKDKVKSRPDLVKLPVLFIHGSNDPLNLVSGVRTFIEQIAYPDKQLRVYEGSLHEPHNDLEHERVASDLVAWLEQHN